MKYILDLLYIFAAIIYSPIVIYRTIRHKRYREGWAQRFGRISRDNPDKKCIWIHAVSVGEVNAAKTVIKELQNRFDDFNIIISTTTDTGQARAKTLFGNQHNIIYFPFDDYTLSKEAKETLTDNAAWLLKNPRKNVVIEGYCDERGTEEYNLALGERRAVSAKRYLMNLGVNPEQLSTISYGEERPADPAHGEDAWSKNRRAEFMM